MRRTLACLCLLFAARGACAQELEPRSYTNTPVGMNFLLAGIGYLEGSVLGDSATLLENTEVEHAFPVIGYARALDVLGNSGKFDVVAPYSCLDGSTEYLGQGRARDVCGWGDPSMRLSVNFFGAPAISLREFAGYRQDLIVGAGVRVRAPLGEYDNDKLLNPGVNRWSITPEIGLSQAVGRVTLELIAAAAYFTDNEDFFGHRKREQDPIYSLQGHVIYSFGNGAWLALDATGYTGGRTTTDDMRGDDLQRNSRLGATLAWPVNRRNSVKLALSSGVSARSGGDYDAIAFMWQHRWGAGL